MAAAKRISRITELENELNDLEYLQQQIENVDEDHILSFLSKTRYISKQEVESAASRVTQALRKAKGESIEIEEKIEPSLDEKYPLINIADDMLTVEQVRHRVNV